MLTPSWTVLRLRVIAWCLVFEASKLRHGPGRLRLQGFGFHPSYKDTANEQSELVVQKVKQ